MITSDLWIAETPSKWIQIAWMVQIFNARRAHNGRHWVRVYTRCCLVYRELLAIQNMMMTSQIYIFLFSSDYSYSSILKKLAIRESHKKGQVEVILEWPKKKSTQKRAFSLTLKRRLTENIRKVMFMIWERYERRKKDNLLCDIKKLVS